MQNPIFIKKLAGTATLLVFVVSTFFVSASFAGATFLKPGNNLTIEGYVDCAQPTCNGYITIKTSSTNAPITIRIPSHLTAPPEDSFVKIQAQGVSEEFYDFVAKNIKVISGGKGQYGTKGDPVKIFEGRVLAINCEGSNKNIVVKFSDFYSASFKIKNDTEFNGKTCSQINDIVKAPGYKPDINALEVKIWGKDTNNGFVAEKIQSKGKQKKDDKKDDKDDKWEKDDDDQKGDWHSDKDDKKDKDWKKDNDNKKGKDNNLGKNGNNNGNKQWNKNR